MRRMLTLLLTLCLMLLPTLAQANAGAIRLVVNGKEVVTDVAPVVEAGRTLVPVRALTEALGFQVAWSEAELAATLTKGDLKVVLYLNKAEAVVNGTRVTMDVPATRREGRILVPVRFVSEQLPGTLVAWNPESQTVSVLSKAAVESPPAQAQPPNPTLPVEPPSPAAPTEVDPAVAALWEQITGQSQSMHLSGKLSTDMAGLVTDMGTVELYAKDGDFLQLMTIDLGFMTVETGAALYKGQTWSKQMGQGWAVTDLADELAQLDPSAILAANATLLAGARTHLSSAELDGVTLSKLEVEWNLAEMATALGLEGEGLEDGTIVLTLWVDQKDGLKQMEQVSTVMLNGQKFINRGLFVIKPWEKEIPFPAEILK